MMVGTGARLLPNGYCDEGDFSEEGMIGGNPGEFMVGGGWLKDGREW